MPAADLTRFFNERYAEVNEYLGLLGNIERAARGGTPRLQQTGEPITPVQQKILRSSLYLQLYNLVEATVDRCLGAITAAAMEARRLPQELSRELRREWVRNVAHTHSDLPADKRLEKALELCDQLLQQLAITEWRIKPVGGGNWDDSQIEKMCRKVGCRLSIADDVRAAAKRHVRDKMSAFQLVKDRRNALAHGSLSFVDCSDGVAFSELEATAKAVGDYLAQAVECFAHFVSSEIERTNGGEIAS